MTYSNFDFLGKNLPELASLGKQAEKFVHLDTQVCAIKLRCLLEKLVSEIYIELHIAYQGEESIYARLKHPDFEESVDTQILTKLHAVRKKGNDAAHAKKEVKVDDAQWLIKEMYLICKWFVQVVQDAPVVVPEFSLPSVPEDLNERLHSLQQKHQYELSNKNQALQLAKQELESLKLELKDKEKEATSKPIFDYSKKEVFKAASEQSASSFDLEMEETLSRVNIKDVFNDVKLTSEQSELVEKLEAFILGKSEQVFLLKGYAGTGKTFITGGLTKYLRMLGRQFVMLAPTGKAAKVISEKTNEVATTIHREIYNYDNVKEYKIEGVEGSETYRCYAEVKPNTHTTETVYIIDEASMLSDVYSDGEFFRFGSGKLLKDLFEYINLDHNDHNKKVIFIGDNAQLPPINMGLSPALSMSYLNKNYHVNTTEFELTQVVRQQADSFVMKNATYLRQSITKELFNTLSLEVGEDIVELNKSNVVDKYMALTDSKLSNTGETVVVASSNKEVQEMNNLIRERFFSGADVVQDRDKIISVANHYLGEEVITNGEFGQIRRVLGNSERRNVILRKAGKNGEYETITVPLTFRDVEIGFRNKLGQPFFIQAKIIESLLYSSEGTLTSDESKALYVDFLKRHPELRSVTKKRELQAKLMEDPYFNAFKVKYGYAITTHKAQGSEWANVIVQCDTYHPNKRTKEYFRWLYTSITRTSKSLFVCNPPNIRVGDGMRVSGFPIMDEFPLAQVQSQQPIVVQEKPEVTNVQSYDITTISPQFQTLAKIVSERLTPQNISISDIVHHSYQELYVLQKGDEFCQVRFNYNGRQRVSTIQFGSQSPLDGIASLLLSDLKGFDMSQYSSSPPVAGLEESFKQEFHQRIIECFEPHEIGVVSVRPLSFCLEYSFVKGAEQAEVKFYYNGKDQFTRVVPDQNSRSPQLLRQLVQLWSEQA
ncbi:ATP-dependent DNA helicase [Vibrio breoganii]|uniref:ATP-dependent DNA helicase n=1 Tax=Vibrio breoganii TaxID=553239 RepID=UPI000C84DB6C|nr:AAA family ATPase [Vibrio breoganii]PMK29522.1 hypothetical protein BCU03_11015 [Vibrio breoganii]